MKDDLTERFRSLDSLHFPHLDGPLDIARSPARSIPDPRPSRGRRVGTIVFALTVAIAAFAFAFRAFRSTPTQPGPAIDVGTGMILYTSTCCSGTSLHTVSADGSSDERMPVDIPDGASHASWSPDGARIVFDAGPESNRDIFTINADGSNLTRITTAEGWDYLPAWSPDGLKIAYVHTIGSNDDIWVMDSDGSNPVRLTVDPDFDLSPNWSPDGTQIVFQSNRSSNNEIYVMNADGSHLRRLTDDPAFDGEPAWSPDGTEIAFASDRDGSGIYVMDPSGSTVRKLTSAPQVGPLQPTWSPDGLQLAFTASPNRRSGTRIGIYVVDLLSGEERTVVGPEDLCCPAWNPTS